MSRALARTLGTLAAALALAAAGCVASPTPHPAQDATGGASQDVIDAGADTPLVDDPGGAPDQDYRSQCEAAGGFWSGAGCYDESGDPVDLDDHGDGVAEDATGDAADAETTDGDTETGGGDAEGDAGDGLVSDIPNE